MASKELIEQVGLIVYKAKRHDSNHEDAAAEIISTTLAALQEPTEAVLEAGYTWDEHVTATETHPRNRGLWRAMLNASALGEQSE